MKEQKPRKLYKTHAEMVRTITSCVSMLCALTTLIVVLVR